MCEISNLWGFGVLGVSRERLEAADAYLDSWIREAKDKIWDFPEIKQFEQDTGKIFNPGSVPQLRTVLFDYAGLTPTGKLTKSGALSTDAEVLEELSEEHPLPKAILTVRQLSKIRSSYVSKILPAMDKDGRIRTNFNNTFTTSGRLSSSGKFNAQQIPRDDPIIKGCIVAPPGYKIVSQDLQTAEMYYAAVLSKDKNLQKVFSEKGDFHSTIAVMPRLTLSFVKARPKGSSSLLACFSLFRTSVTSSMLNCRWMQNSFGFLNVRI